MPVIDSSLTPIAFVATADQQRAKQFYLEVLGLEILHEDDFAIVFKLGTCSLRMVQVQNFKPQPFTVLGWQVENIETYATKLRDHKVDPVRYPNMDQDDLGVWYPPGSPVGILWFRDSEDNLLSITGGR